MSRVVKCAHIQASNAKNDGTPAEIKEAMIQKHIPLIEEAGKKGVNILSAGNFLRPLFLRRAGYQMVPQRRTGARSDHRAPGPVC